MTDWYKDLTDNDKKMPSSEKQKTDWYSELFGEQKKVAKKDAEPLPFVPTDAMSMRQKVGAVATPIVGGIADLVGLPQAVLSAPGQFADWIGWEPGTVATALGYSRKPRAFNRPPSPNDKVITPADGSAVPGLPTTRDVQEFAHDTLGVPRYDATSAGGKLAQMGLRGAVAGAVAGPTGAVLGGVSGASSEGAGQLAESAGLGPTGQTVARVAGGLVPAVGYGVYRGIRRTPGAIANEALDGVSPQQLQQAQALMDAAQARGVPITAAEAIAQVTGGNPIQNVQRVVEQSRGGGQTMSKFMAPRPEQVREAVTSQLDEIAQPRVPADVVRDVSDAARERIQAARSARTQASSPHYQAAVNDPIDMMAKQPVLDMVTDTLKSVGPGGPNAKLLREFAGRVKMATNAAQLDDVYKTYRDRLAALPIEKNAVSTTQRGTLTPIVAKLGEVLKVESQNIDTGRALHTANSSRVDYLRRPDMMGNLEKALPATGNVSAAQTRQAGVVFDPASARPETIRAVAAELKASSKPNAFNDLVRAHMARKLDESMGLARGTPNQWAGSRFVGNVAGTPQARENLTAALEALPTGAQVAPRTQGLLDVLSATGYRQAPGSMTEFNKQITGEMSGGVLRGATRPMSFLGDAYERFRYGANSRSIADILTAPDGVEQLVKLARTLPEGAKRQAVIQTLLAVERAQNAVPASSGAR